MNILSNSQYDLSACLKNCSNNGICLLNITNQKYSCQCFNNFNGISCQFDSRSCSYYPCLNNGTCLNSNLNSTEFVCQCKLNYYGVFCENKIDLCQNQTCSNNGYCFINNTQPICKCFNGYNGDKCELENVSVKILRVVRISSFLICGLTIGFTIFLVVSNDIWNFFMIKKKKKQKVYSKNIKRFTYKAK
jgi:hypothetical protein